LKYDLEDDTFEELLQNDVKAEAKVAEKKCLRQDETYSNTTLSQTSQSDSPPATDQIIHDSLSMKVELGFISGFAHLNRIPVFLYCPLLGYRGHNKVDHCRPKRIVDRLWSTLKIIQIYSS